MGMLKWFNRERYDGLGTALEAIRQELKSLQPSDSSDIVWSKSANGMSAKLRGNNATSTQNESEDSPVQAQSSYNGYFTIKLRTLEDGTKKIVVCDGATYDAEKGTSGDSLAYTSGPSHWVPYYEVPATEADSKRYIVAEFTPPVYTADGTIDKVGYVSIVMCKDYYRYENGLEEPVEGVYERYVYLIGEVIKDGENVRVIQRHGMGLGGERTSQNYFNGAIYIEYYESCVS